jgi:hypothetical protein
MVDFLESDRRGIVISLLPLSEFTDQEKLVRAAYIDESGGKSLDRFRHSSELKIKFE